MYIYIYINFLYFEAISWVLGVLLIFFQNGMNFWIFEPKLLDMLGQTKGETGLKIGRVRRGTISPIHCILSEQFNFLFFEPPELRFSKIGKKI